MELEEEKIIPSIAQSLPPPPSDSILCPKEGYLFMVW